LVEFWQEKKNKKNLSIIANNSVNLDQFYYLSLMSAGSNKPPALSSTWGLLNKIVTKKNTKKI